MDEGAKHRSTELERLKRQVSRLQKEIVQKNEEVENLKASFLSNISHEIRTPMNAILGFSNLLKDADLNYEERVTFIEGINKSSFNLLKLIDNLILAAKTESEKIQINECECIVEDILNEVVKHHEREKFQTGKKHIEIRFPRNHKKKVLVKTDREKLSIVVSHLLENAIKFTEEGHIEIGYEPLAHNKVKIYVKDSGIGIPESKLNAIFSKFNQIENSYRRNYNGLGIGLTISKNLLENMGGCIWVKSTVGKGSEFCIELPCKEIQTETTEHYNEIFSDKKRILGENMYVDSKYKELNKNIHDYTLFSHVHNFRA